MTEMILTSSVLILLLILMRRVLRGRIHPGVQYALWLLAAARLLIPGTLFPLPVSMVGAAEELRASIQETYPGPATPDSSPAVAPSYHVPENEAVLIEDISSLPEFSRWELVSWPELIWKTGMAATAGTLVISNLAFYFRLRRTRRRLTLPDTPWTGKLPIYEADGLASPCLSGLFRPGIYLNEAAMDAEHPEHILAHEYAHYRHGDHLWALLRSVCLIVHWYNPLVWWAAALSRRDCELACDAAALRRLGEAESIEYGQTLLGMVSRRTSPAALLHTATTMTAGKRAMTERIALIVRKPRMRKITLALVAALVCLLAACSFGGGEAKAPEGTEPSDGVAGDAPAAVYLTEMLSSQYRPGPVTDPETVSRLWELYKGFRFDGTAEEFTRDNAWSVMVSFRDAANTELAHFTIFDGGLCWLEDDYDTIHVLQDGQTAYDAFRDACRSAPRDEGFAAAPPEEPESSEPVQDAMQENARSIVEQVRQGVDAGEWLPLMNYMDWGVLARAAVEAGLDDGDGSGFVAQNIMGAIGRYIERQRPFMTQGEYYYLLSASDGLDGALTEGCADMFYQLYDLNPSQFAFVVLEMLPEAQRNETLDLFRGEWMFHKEPYRDTAPSREEAVAQLEADLAVGVLASPGEMTLESAGSTFYFQLVNAYGVYALSYSSSDPEVAAVDESGVVTAVGPGEAVITLLYEGSGGPLEFSCTVSCDW